MCGIAGIITLNSKVNPDNLKQMTDSLIHRGPDGEGQWTNENKTIGLGHRRLSIIDLTKKGTQPMHYANGRYTITFNGEIYNYIELKKELQKKGFTFKSDSDTEVLLALFDLKKEKCLDDLDGMFSFAIWDEYTQELFCARDRFGEKPFFYYLDKKSFSFASEMKALWATGTPKTKNLKRYYQYLMYGNIDDPIDKSSTFFQNIFQLKPAHYIIIKKDLKIKQIKYWDIDLTIELDISFEDAQKRFRELFLDSVNKRLRSDVPIGSSLSGGLDSSSIVMAIDRLKAESQKQKTFSARFKNFEKDEGKFIDLITRSANVECFSVYPTAKSANENFEKLIYHQEEPFGSFSINAQFEVMKLAKNNNVIVLQDGQGADEILAGYERHFEAYLQELYKSNRNKFNLEFQDFKNLRNNNSINANLNFKFEALNYKLKRKASELAKNIKRTTSTYFNGINPELVSEYKKIENPLYFAPNLKERLYHSTINSGLTELLRYSDRNSMAHSIEVRLPFLSHKLVEFLFSLPNEYLIKSGWTKFILRKSMEDLLPDKITWRKDKIGYAIPQDDWQANSFFEKKITCAVTKLKDHKIITHKNEQLNWQYLMLANCI